MSFLSSSPRKKRKKNPKTPDQFLSQKKKGSAKSSEKQSHLTVTELFGLARTKVHPKRHNSYLPGETINGIRICKYSSLLILKLRNSVHLSMLLMLKLEFTFQKQYFFAPDIKT